MAKTLNFLKFPVQDSIYSVYNEIMTNHLQNRKREHAPELVTVLRERFSEDDLEIYRAWKKGAIRRIPLKVDEITKVSHI